MESPILVPKSGSLSHVITLNGGTLAFETQNGSDGKELKDVVYTLYKGHNNTQNKVPIANRKRNILNLSEGPYFVVANYNGHTVSQKTSVVAGQKLKLRL